MFCVHAHPSLSSHASTQIVLPPACPAQEAGAPPVIWTQLLPVEPPDRVLQMVLRLEVHEGTVRSGNKEDRGYSIGFDCSVFFPRLRRCGTFKESPKLVMSCIPRNVSNPHHPLGPVGWWIGMIGSTNNGPLSVGACRHSGRWWTALFATSNSGLRRGSN